MWVSSAAGSSNPPRSTPTDQSRQITEGPHGGVAALFADGGEGAVEFRDGALDGGFNGVGKERAHGRAVEVHDGVRVARGPGADPGAQAGNEAEHIGEVDAA